MAAKASHPASTAIILRVEVSQTPQEHVVSRTSGRAAINTGVARGLNIAPGSEDDGWEVPRPVTLPDGSAVRLLKDGEALRRWYDAIKAARRSVFLETYIFADDETGRGFKDLLIEKARAGVRCYLIYDSFGSWDTPRQFFAEMQSAGVRVHEFHPIAPWRCNFSWRPFNRDHRKLIIVDSAFVGLGGFNIANEYGGSWVMHDQTLCDNLWRDCGIELEGPAISPFIESFRRTWLYIGRGGRVARAMLSHNLDGSDGSVGLLASVPSIASPMSRMIRKLLHHPRRSVDLTSAYFAPDDELIDLLCRAAGRGVRVRLMMPSLTDVHIMVTAARSFYDQLLAAGIEVYERQHVRLHAKTLLVDDEVSVLGSTNFDHRSIDYNCELAVVVRSPQFGVQMRDLFDHDIAFSQRIDPAVWRHRPVRDRLMQWAVNRSRTLL